jgi:hypothetical protein
MVLCGVRSHFAGGKPRRRATSQIINERRALVKNIGYITKYKDQIIIGLLLMYVAVLGFGVIGEFFKIEWILNFPLFRL